MNDYAHLFEEDFDPVAVSVAYAFLHDKHRYMAFIPPDLNICPILWIKRIPGQDRLYEIGVRLDFERGLIFPTAGTNRIYRIPHWRWTRMVEA